MADSAWKTALMGLPLQCSQSHKVISIPGVLLLQLLRLTTLAGLLTLQLAQASLGSNTSIVMRLLMMISLATSSILWKTSRVMALQDLITQETQSSTTSMMQVPPRTPQA